MSSTAAARKQLLIKLWLWFANVITSWHFILHYSHSLLASKSQAKTELCGICDFLSLLINNNHLSIKNLKSELKSKTYRKSLQKITVSPGKTQAEVEGSYIMDTVEKITRVMERRNESLRIDYFFQSEVQIVIF